jgi:hypothetical protein
MAIKRNPLSEKRNPSADIIRTADEPAHEVEAFISQAVDPPAARETASEKIYPWEESGPEIVNQQYFQMPLGNKRKLELFWRISRD